MAFKMYGKTPMTKALVGKQKNLPANLRAAIEAAPETPMNTSESFIASSNVLLFDSTARS